MHLIELMRVAFLRSPRRSEHVAGLLTQTDPCLLPPPRWKWSQQSIQFVTLMVGHFLFRMHPGILLGECAGIATPAVAAVQEVAKSSVPILG